MVWARGHQEVINPSVPQPTIQPKMDRHLMLILKENGVPESFQEWMLAAGLITPFDFGIVVKERDNLDSAIGSYNIPGFVQDDMTAIREAWLVCRGIADQEIGVLNGLYPTMPMVASTFDELVRTWRRKHHFTLHAHRLLAGELLNKRHIEVNARPPALSVIPVDNIRMSLNVERRTARDQLWLRMRTDLNSIAYVSIHSRTFFDFDTSENAMELVHGIGARVSLQNIRGCARVSFILLGRLPRDVEEMD